MKIFKISFSILFFLLNTSLFSQTLSIIDCSSILILPEGDEDAIVDDLIEIDTNLDITMDSMWTSQSDFDVMLIIELSDTTEFNKVHIQLGNNLGDSTLLNSSYDNNSNLTEEDVYEAYDQFVNVRIGEFEIDSFLFYNIKLEDFNGDIISTFSDTLKK